MKNKEQMGELIDDVFNSLDNVKRANPAPFLLTRINARLQTTRLNLWDKAGSFISRPAFAIPGLLLLIVVNFMVVIYNTTDPFTVATEQTAFAPSADDFSFAESNIFDIENLEP